MQQHVNPQDSGAELTRVVGDIVARARAAQKAYLQLGQEGFDTAVSAVAWAIMEDNRNRQLAERAVQDTGLGNVDDKIRKNYRKTLGLLRDLKGVKSFGVLSDDTETGIMEIARPVGVVAAITPSTNPAATPANKIINALKCGNAVIVAPSPKGMSTSKLLLQYVHAEFRKCDIPLDLVQLTPEPVTKAGTAELMRQCDLVVATGSQANVRMAYGSGTPAFGVGAGNVAAIIDASADLADAAGKITQSKTFDNATSCSSENSIVVLDSVYDRMLAELESCGAVLLSAEERQRLQEMMWRAGRLAGAVSGKNAADIAAMAGLSRVTACHDGHPRILMVEEDGFGPDHPFSGEKLSPVLTVYRARSFMHACEIVSQIYDYMGAGHSVSVHTTDAAQALQLGQALPVARVIVNQAHCFATGGSFDNGLPFSLSMGCGTWGGNNFSDNMNYRHYMNTTRVVRQIPEKVPSTEDMLGEYFAAYGK